LSRTFLTNNNQAGAFVDVSSLAGASGGVMIVFAVLKLGEYIRDVMLKREARVDEETKIVKLNGTKCDGHSALCAEIVSIKDDVKEVKGDIKDLSHKLDDYLGKLFERQHEIEKDVAVLQAKG